MSNSALDIHVQEESLTEQIEQIKRMLKTETSKKLNYIESYLTQNLRINVTLQTKEDLESFLRSENADSEIIMDIFDLLDQSFSRGYPQYVFEFQLNSNTTQQNFLRLLMQDYQKTNQSRFLTKKM
ncbi:hypothetical protein ACT7CX_18520 [Bacillus cereus]